MRSKLPSLAIAAGLLAGTSGLALAQYAAYPSAPPTYGAYAAPAVSPAYQAGWGAGEFQGYRSGAQPYAGTSTVPPSYQAGWGAGEFQGANPMQPPPASAYQPNVVYGYQQPGYAQPGYGAGYAGPPPTR